MIQCLILIAQLLPHIMLNHYKHQTRKTPNTQNKYAKHQLYRTAKHFSKVSTTAKRHSETL